MKEGMISAETLNLISSTIREHIDPAALVLSIDQQSGDQGMSGSEVAYFDVVFDIDGAQETTSLIIKQAPLMERRIHLHLCNQGLAVPFCFCDDLVSAESAPLCIQQLPTKQKQHSDVEQTASALAQIHAANLGAAQSLDWVPRADETFASDWVVDACWRQSWDRLLKGGEFVDGYGRSHGVPKPGGDFSAEFAPITHRIEAAGKRFVQTMAQWWEEGDSLTLIHADFHGDHVFSDKNGNRYIIDWGAAKFGPLYLDLPNYFSRDDSLVYREALAALGHDIPHDKFLANYDAASMYPGFKYIGIGLWNWCFGDPPHQPESTNYFVNLILQKKEHL